MSRDVEAAVEPRIRIRTEVRASAGPSTAPCAITLKDVNFSYGTNHVLHDVNVDVDEKRVTAFIGPSGCGKSTLLRCLNRMNDLIDSVRIEGGVKIGGF